MKAIHWLEAKQLDRVTNFSTETECIKNILKKGSKIYYYCTFKKEKKYYGLDDNIIYLSHLKNKYLKGIEFLFNCLFKPIQIVLTSDRNVFMVNQDLVVYMIPAIFLNKLMHKSNRFIVDVRTLPTSPKSFEKDMAVYNKQLVKASRYFDGLSFITPFLEKVTLSKINKKLPTVNWSSGVNLSIFNADNYDYSRDTDRFRIFYHGGISLSRGNLDLIKACEIVVSKGYKIELIQIGKVVDEEVRNYVNEHNCSLWCKVLDARPINEMPALIAKCDLPVLPFPDFLAWRVSSPIKLMEYLAMGKPVLVPDMECFTDVLSEDSGMVYYYNLDSDNQVNLLAKAIIERVSHFKAEKTCVKNENCIDYVSENFTWEKQSENLLNFCKSLC